jgi:hypothetical protein
MGDVSDSNLECRPLPQNEPVMDTTGATTPRLFSNAGFRALRG